MYQLLAVGIATSQNTTSWCHPADSLADEGHVAGGVGLTFGLLHQQLLVEVPIVKHLHVLLRLFFHACLCLLCGGLSEDSGVSDGGGRMVGIVVEEVKEIVMTMKIVVEETC